MASRKLFFHDTTRGGQTWFHYLRMFGQNLRRSLWLCLIGALLTSVSGFYLITDQEERYFGGKWVHAYVKMRAMSKFAGPIKVEYQGQESWLKPVQIVHHKDYRENIKKVGYKLAYALYFYGTIGFLLSVIGLYFYFRHCGRKQVSDSFIRGNVLASNEALRKALKQNAKEDHNGKTSGLKLAGFPIPYRQETAHFLLAGSPGTGKSLAMQELLHHVRKKQQRAVVYDVAGDFIQRFYRPDRDIILNPFDQRSARWDIWCDCQEEYDYAALAEALIPEDRKGDFFVTAARLVFASMAEQLANTVKQGQAPSMNQLIEWVLRCDIETLTRLVQGTDAASILNEEAGKMATSVRGVMAAYTKPLKYLHKDGERFSLRDWVRHGDPDSWVFISSTDEQKALLTPLITVWINTVASAIMSLVPDPDRRIFLAVDELPSLNQLPSLENFLAQGRKYGGCGIIGFQNISQLEKIWGREGAKSLTGLLSTWLIYRCEEKNTAQWASDNLYKQEVMEASENLSYGAHSMRDGVSINPQKKERALVTPTEIMGLKDCTGYLRFGRGLPISKVRIHRMELKAVAENFIKRSSNDRQDDQDKPSRTPVKKQAKSDTRETDMRQKSFVRKVNKAIKKDSEITQIL